MDVTTENATPTATLRPVGDDDREFLYRVYASTRDEELRQVDWPAEQKESFLRMQFDAQHRHYAQYFPDARFDVILRDGRPVGRLYVDRRDDEIRIVDVALLHEYRGRGIGTRLIGELLAEGADSQRPVRIHVEQTNPAMGLYRRLGFKKVAETGVYHLMQWLPASCAPTEDDTEHRAGKDSHRNFTCT